MLKIQGMRECKVLDQQGERSHDSIRFREENERPHEIQTQYRSRGNPGIQFCCLLWTIKRNQTVEEEERRSQKGGD